MNKQQTVEKLFDTMGQLRKLLLQHSLESHEERAATIMQYSALKILNTTLDCTVGDIAKQLYLSKSSATQLIERLVKAGLVERIHDTQDRRLVRLHVTEQGKQTVAALKKKFIEKMSTVLSRIPTEDLNNLIRIQTNLINTLQTK